MRGSCARRRSSSSFRATMAKETGTTERLRRKSPTVSEGSQLMEALKKTRGSRMGCSLREEAASGYVMRKVPAIAPTPTSTGTGAGTRLKCAGSVMVLARRAPATLTRRKCAVREKARGERDRRVERRGARGVEASPETVDGRQHARRWRARRRRAREGECARGEDHDASPRATRPSVSAERRRRRRYPESC